MSCLKRDAILAANDLKIEQCSTPEWGDGAYVYVKSMTAHEKEQWEQQMLAARGDDEQANLGRVRASLAAGTICDELGTLQFGSADIDALNAKSALALDRVFETARKLNRIGKQDVDDLVGKSDAALADASPSVSA